MPPRAGADLIGRGNEGKNPGSLPHGTVPRLLGSGSEFVPYQ